MIAEGLAGQPEGQFGALLRKLRAALKDMSDTTDYQVAQPARYITALIALGQGDLAAARNAAGAGLRLGTRAEADEADRLRARHREIPERITARCAELAG